jgi:hypothetical protein
MRKLARTLRWPFLWLLLFAIAGCNSHRPEATQVVAVKVSQHNGKALGELFAKHCDDGRWSFSARDDIVEFEGLIKKSGQYLKAQFQVVKKDADGETGWTISDRGPYVGGNGPGNKRTFWHQLVFEEDTSPGLSRGKN